MTGFAILLPRLEGGFKLGPQGIEASLASQIEEAVSVVKEEVAAESLTEEQAQAVLGSAVEELVREWADHALTGGEPTPAAARIAARQMVADYFARFLPGGSVDAALDWTHRMFHQRDFHAAWLLMDARLRMVLVQEWLLAKFGAAPDIQGISRDALAHALSTDPRDHPLFAEFAQTQLAAFLASWAGFDPDEWGAASRPRYTEEGCDLIIMTRTEGQVWYINKPTPLHVAVKVLMRSTEAGWRVAGFNDHPPTPGWPPLPGWDDQSPPEAEAAVTST
jgi:hypothetical protein